MELPKIFKNKNVHSNNLKTYYSLEKDIKKNNNNLDYDNKTVSEKLNKIMDTRNRFMFTENVIIETDNKKYDTKIISRNDEYILTIDNDKILINDIKNIISK